MTEQRAAAERSELRAMIMSSVAVALLALLAAMIPHGGVASAVSEFVISSRAVLILFFILWALIIAEGIVGFATAPDRNGKALSRLALVALVPPMRMTVSPSYPNDHVWLPKRDWVETGKAAVADMEMRTALPMLIVTALIVPVIITDFVLGKKPHILLSEELPAITHFAPADTGERLFLLDGDETVRMNIERRAPTASEGLSGEWIVRGKPAGTEPSILNLDAEGRFRLETGCATTAGSLTANASELKFSEVEALAKCPPTFLEMVVYLVTALIWFSFAFEFILMVSLADKKLAFCKKNWINIVIILLPLLAFLRSLQLFRFLRMAKAGKLMRAYRLRGLVTRAAKLAMVFNLIERFLSRNPDKFDAHLRAQIADKEEELAELKAKLPNSESSA